MSEAELNLRDDACPFSRPFPLDFAECPEYRPIVYVSTDLAYHQLKDVLTCQHLQMGVAERGRYYPRCGVGAPTRRIHAAV